METKKTQVVISLSFQLSNEREESIKAVQQLEMLVHQLNKKRQEMEIKMETEQQENVHLSGKISDMQGVKDEMVQVQQTLSEDHAENNQLKECALQIANLKKEFSIRERDMRLKLQKMQQRLEEEQAKHEATKAQLMRKTQLIGHKRDTRKWVRDDLVQMQQDQAENYQLREKIAILKKEFSIRETDMRLKIHRLQRRLQEEQTKHEATKAQLFHNNRVSGCKQDTKKCRCHTLPLSCPRQAAGKGLNSEEGQLEEAPKWGIVGQLLKKLLIITRGKRPTHQPNKDEDPKTEVELQCLSDEAWANYKTMKPS